jgi:hypothetical protein
MLIYLRGELFFNRDWRKETFELFSPFSNAQAMMREACSKVARSNSAYLFLKF